MKKARMNISHSRFILFKLKILGEIVTTYFFLVRIRTVECIRTRHNKPILFFEHY